MPKENAKSKTQSIPLPNSNGSAAGASGQYLAMPQETAQAILSYLTTRPYREVASLINEIAKVRPIQNTDLSK